MVNLNKYISDLPANTSLDGSELFELQKGAGGTTGSSQNLTLANLAGKIGSLISNLFASPAQGAKADSALQSIVAQPYTTVDNTNPQNPKIGISTQVAKRDISQSFSKSQTVSPVVNAAATGTITPDCSASNTFEYTVTGALTIANPTNTVAGQFINFLIAENTTGGFTITLGSNFKVMNGTSFVTTANTVNVISGYVASNGNIYCNISQ